MKSITLNLDIEELYKLNKFIEDTIHKNDFQVELILEEIFVNIVKYSESDFLKVNAEYDGSLLTMEFIDNGIEFNPLLKENPNLPSNIDDAKVGGLGIFLTKQMADNLEYEYANGENHLKITKKVEQ
ncbi:MAG: ATP-binding protein [Methanobrevibacter sp.]|nr:ATP-binding protein [Methanobrevibacter sp.]